MSLLKVFFHEFRWPLFYERLGRQRTRGGTFMLLMASLMVIGVGIGLLLAILCNQFRFNMYFANNHLVEHPVTP